MTQPLDGQDSRHRANPPDFQHQLVREGEIRREKRAQGGKARAVARGSRHLSKTLVTPESIGDTNLIFKNALIMGNKEDSKGLHAT